MYPGFSALKHLWVVEVQFGRQGAWEATLAVSLSRKGGQAEVKHWQEFYPGEKFRLRKYVRVEN